MILKEVYKNPHKFKGKMIYKSKEKIMEGFCLGYCRTSIEKNAKKGSLKRQVEAILAFGERHNVPVAAIFYDVESGGDFFSRRPGAKAMIKYGQENGVRRIVFDDAARFSRGGMDEEIAVRSLKNRGFVLSSASAPEIYSENATQEMFRSISASINKQQRSDILHKTAKGSEARREKEKAKGNTSRGGSGKSGGMPRLEKKYPGVKEVAEAMIPEFTRKDGFILWQRLSTALAERHPEYRTRSGRPLSYESLRCLFDFDYAKFVHDRQQRLRAAKRQKKEEFEVNKTSIQEMVQRMDPDTLAEFTRALREQVGDIGS